MIIEQWLITSLLLFHLFRLQHFGEDVVAQSLKLAEPITSRFNGQLHFLDDQALKVLTFAESKWSYPFKATPQQVASLPLSVIQAYSDALTKAYEERVAPGVQAATSKFEEVKSQNAFVRQTVDVLGGLQTRLEKVLEQVKSTGKAGEEKAAGEAKGLINSIFEEVSGGGQGGAQKVSYFDGDG